MNHGMAAVSVLKDVAKLDVFLSRGLPKENCNTSCVKTNLDDDDNGVDYDDSDMRFVSNGGPL